MNTNYTPEQIAQELEVAKFIEYPSNVKTLAAIVVQLQAEIAKEDREHLETIKERDHFEDAISNAALALECEEEWSNVHDHAECIVELSKELRAEVDAHRTGLIEGAKQSVVVTRDEFFQVISEEKP